MDKSHHHSFSQAKLDALVLNLKSAVADLAPYFPDHYDDLLTLYLRNHEGCMAYCGKERAMHELQNHIAGLKAYKMVLKTKTH